MTTATKAPTYNGWANYETWNVALWINNEHYNYQIARLPSSQTYLDFVVNMEAKHYSNLDAKHNYRIETGDGVSWTDSKLDLQALDELILEIGSH
mgnify:CR=1 FL=1